MHEALNESCPDPGKRVKNPNLFPAIPPQVLAKAVFDKFSGKSSNPGHPPMKRMDPVAGKGRVPEAIA
jgi:hypothetical protein